MSNELQINQIVNFYPKGKIFGKMFESKVVKIDIDNVFILLNNIVFRIKKNNVCLYIETLKPE